ncbi:MAG: hypothetical protein ACD_73C00071G0002 [uncultured bacterium]|nr:MAG: hypothetical protein ACD_73C00071G0002 [uncultured bacterium]
MCLAQYGTLTSSQENALNAPGQFNFLRLEKELVTYIKLVHYKMESLLKQKAHEIGFELVGITQALPHPHFEFYKTWIEKGFHGNMEWMQRHLEKKSDLRHLLPEVKSLIVCGLSYNKPYPRSIEVNEASKGWISNYAWGDDYHNIVLEKLKALETFIQEKVPGAKCKSYVDTGAILERSYAHSAGLGWIGKNTLLINQKKGSFFFIGEILTDLVLEADAPDTDHCGKCTRCLDACPTQALTPHELDAGKCISYLTIEHRDEIEAGLAQKTGHHLVGCDICQDVCPFNKKAEYSSEAAFEPRSGLLYPDLAWAQSLDETSFKEVFKKNPVKRVKLEGWQRNVALAKKNQTR